MKKIMGIINVLLFLLLVTGCSHKAAALKENGVWEQRNLALVHDPDNFDEEEVDLSIKVNEEMTENDMLIQPFPLRRYHCRPREKNLPGPSLETPLQARPRL